MFESLCGEAFDKIDEMSKREYRGNTYVLHAFFCVHDALNEWVQLDHDADKDESDRVSDMGENVRKLREALDDVKTPRELAEWSHGLREARR